MRQARCRPKLPFVAHLHAKSLTTGTPVKLDLEKDLSVVGALKEITLRNKTAELAGYSAAQVKRIWAEVSQAEAKQHGAFVEDALTEADALAAVGQDERQEERA